MRSWCRAWLWRGGGAELQKSEEGAEEVHGAAVLCGSSAPWCGVAGVEVKCERALLPTREIERGEQ
jgi:hypothetical protein